MNEVEIVERLARVEERAKSNTHQIEELKPVIEEIHTMSRTMVELIGEVKHTNEEVTKTNENVSALKEKVETIESEPVKNWSDTKKTFFTSITSAIGTAVAAGILYLISKGGI
jgi:predicted  nucleic acid-binding Zn-ribbon protein